MGLFSLPHDSGDLVILQTEKQRIIWAYKILFLDVLFPLNLRKVIFVDSDQIMRADFAELLKMDLQVWPPQMFHQSSIRFLAVCGMAIVVKTMKS